MGNAADDWDTSQGVQPTTEATSREQWEQLPANPDLCDDLGYELSTLEVYETDDGQVVVLPKDEQMLHEDAFIVIAEEDMQTLGEGDG